MANYATLKAAIAAAISENGNNEITGNLLQQQLLAMVNSLGVGYQYIGMATPVTNPGTPDQNVFYIASEAGTYSNFSGIVVAENEVAILKWNGTWAKETTGAATAAQLNQLGQDLENQLDDRPHYDWRSGGFDPSNMDWDSNPNYAHSTPVSLVKNYLAFQHNVRFVVYFDSQLNIVDYSDQSIDQGKVERYPYASIVTTGRGIIFTSPTPYSGVIPRLNNFDDSDKILKSIDNFYLIKGGWDTTNEDWDSNPNYVHTNLIDVSNNILQVYFGGAVRMVVYYDSYMNRIGVSDSGIDNTLLESAKYVSVVLFSTSVSNHTVIYTGKNTFALSILMGNGGISLDWVQGGWDTNLNDFNDSPYYHHTQKISIKDNILNVTPEKAIRFILYYSDWNTLAYVQDFEQDPGIHIEYSKLYDYVVFVCRTYGVGQNYELFKVFTYNKTIVQRIDDIEKDSIERSIKRYRFLMFTFVSDYSGLFLLGSNDLYKWTAIRKKAFYKPQTPLFNHPVQGEIAKALRDPAFIQIGEYFYITYTINSFWQNTGVGNHIGLCRTKDFVNFEELPDLVITNPNLDLSNGWAWAPDFFRINGKIYIVCSVSHIASHTEAEFYHYICEFNEQTLSLENCFKTNINDIDAHIYYENGKYYAIQSGNIVWQSDTLLSTNYQVINTDVQIRSYEGQFMLRTDGGKHILFGQNVYYSEGEDLPHDAHMFFQVFENLTGAFGTRHQLEYDSDTETWLHQMAGVNYAEAYHCTIFDKNNWLTNNNNFFTF